MARSMVATIRVVLLAGVVCLRSADAGALRGLDDALHDALRGLDGIVNDRALGQLRLALAESGAPPEVEGRVDSMLEALRPVYQALPRSEDGRLEAAAVRYLLHRYFVDRDGWFVQGNDALGEVADDSLPKVLLNDGDLARELSARLRAGGLTLREVAVLASALETVASVETQQRLHAAYRIVELGHREDHATETELMLVLDIYMQMYTLGFDHHVHTWKAANATWKNIYTLSPTWDQLKKWVHEVRSEVLAAHPEQRSTFDGQVKVLEEVQHRYGRWQDQSCLEIKEGLLEYATPGTGRVPLSRFYNASLPGGWKALESKAYLQHMGALDESDPSNPSVVIPNYFDTPSNCGQVSRYYRVCCISGCESLLGHLERKLGSPRATPQQIIDIVEKLPSATVDAPRKLPVQLIKRLESIAELHGDGHAPMHGRLFRQWMHHAYPAECSFPGLSTDEMPLKLEEFERRTGQKATIDDSILVFAVDVGLDEAAGATSQRGVKQVAAVGDAEFFEELPWLDEEELFLSCTGAELKESTVTVWRAAIFLAIVASMVHMLAQNCKTTRNVALPQYRKKVDMV